MFNKVGESDILDHADMIALRSCRDLYLPFRHMPKAFIETSSWYLVSAEAI